MSTWYFNSFNRSRVSYTSVIILLAYLLAPSVSKAQHCPFDGGSMIVVKLTDHKGNPVIGANELILVEVSNPSPDSCSFSGKLLSLEFLPVKQAFEKHYKMYGGQLEKNCTECTYLGQGNYAVVLTMDERTCMIKKEGDYSYRPRKFEIRYSGKAGRKNIPVPPDRIYSLCTEGKWSRIMPLAITP
jgi:hypothetical protein